jgi:hypothetical protein
MSSENSTQINKTLIAEMTTDMEWMPIHQPGNDLVLTQEHSSSSQLDRHQLVRNMCLARYTYTYTHLLRLTWEPCAQGPSSPQTTQWACSKGMQWVEVCAKRY